MGAFSYRSVGNDVHILDQTGEVSAFQTAVCRFFLQVDAAFLQDFPQNTAQFGMFLESPAGITVRHLKFHTENFRQHLQMTDHIVSMSCQGTAQKIFDHDFIFFCRDDTGIQRRGCQAFDCHGAVLETVDHQIQIIQEIVAVLLNNDFFRICRFEDDTESGIAEFQFSFDPGLAPADGCFQLPGIGFRDKYSIRLARDGIEFQAAGKGGKHREC